MMGAWDVIVSLVAAVRQVLLVTMVAFTGPLQKIGNIQSASAVSTHAPNSPDIEIDWSDDEAWDSYLLKKKRMMRKVSGPLPLPPPLPKGPEDDEVWDSYLLLKKRQNAKGPVDPISLCGPLPW
ncbi:unnamed protein product [Vitrella brassicaformis CCMP3155]|uniref:Uncharacterized protein n=1 Tax=Vitrella brassicaformis (strain CCMP3155) TaxID=1169540 RepID=A0A0G4EG84_VITBC|nr:unnamed protein product [Vitrella brassicaformis CCMP3155]|eukprot:CEL94463.1 unnamed protein product [Vitrella brassicaformis CCMP3155]